MTRCDPRRAAGTGRLALLLWAAGLACSPAYLDPGAAGPDFELQGEYDGPGWGAQLIALGEGRFAAVFLKGGLPGSGWDGASRVLVPGERSGSEAVFRGRYEATARGAELHGFTDAGDSFALRKTLRQSSTLGAPPPPAARVLFGGGPDASGPGGFDGELGEGGALAVGATSREAFQDFRLHLEFRTPFMPGARGQRRGNSGVYLQNRYEIQILDSFGLEAAEDGCGALYALKPPDLNLAFPPLAWQTFDVSFEAARFDASGRKTRDAIASVRHNGVLVHDRVPIPGPTGGGEAEGPEPGPLHLQDHGSPVVFRNVWIVERGAGPPGL